MKLMSNDSGDGANKGLAMDMAQLGGGGGGGELWVVCGAGRGRTAQLLPDSVIYNSHMAPYEVPLLPARRRRRVGRRGRTVRTRSSYTVMDGVQLVIYSI